MHYALKEKDLNDLKNLAMTLTPKGAGLTESPPPDFFCIKKL